MSYTINYTEKALDDLNDCFDYIILADCDVIAAERFIDSITDYIEILTENPELGKILVLESYKTNYRYLVYKKYMIFYSVANNNIDILRIIHSRRDNIAILFQEEL